MQNRWLSVIIMAILLCSGCAPKNDSTATIMTGEKIHVTEELVLSDAELIVGGRITQKSPDYFSNPDGKRVDAEGEVISNARITEYEFEVETVYKGSLERSTLTFRTYNDQFLSVDQALKGDKTQDPIYSDIEELELEIGECILALSWFEAETFGGPPGYMVTFDGCGYFLPVGDGLYENQTTGLNHFTVDPSTWPQKIAALQK